MSPIGLQSMWALVVRFMLPCDTSTPRIDLTRWSMYKELVQERTAHEVRICSEHAGLQGASWWQGMSSHCGEPLPNSAFCCRAMRARLAEQRPTLTLDLIAAKHLLVSKDDVVGARSSQASSLSDRALQQLS